MYFINLFLSTSCYTIKKGYYLPLVTLLRRDTVLLFDIIGIQITIWLLDRYSDYHLNATIFGMAAIPIPLWFGDSI